MANRITKRNKPTIVRIGKVDQVGMRLVIHGWEIDPCLRNCDCHRSPSGDVVLFQGTNSLGLHKKQQCGCCEPWTGYELQAFLIELAHIVAMPTSEEQQPS